MNNFIMANWDSLLLVALVVAGLIVMARAGYIKQVRQILFYLVTEAEAQFGGGTGQLKYAAVATWLFERLPAIAKMILTPKTIDELIEEAVEQMKIYLRANEKARSLIETDEALE
ncbi:hypothetical protein [Gudongella sp. SC589]|uniref:hypothetical protein n=1 Tax=Gudongella sp. SC589 TaxID=3385990 RepID=UPI00390472BF